MKYRVSELEGVPLDAAVAKAEGWRRFDGTLWRPQKVQPPFPSPEPMDALIAQIEPFAFSNDWQFGGPIIQRERMLIGYCGDSNAYWPKQWFAQHVDTQTGDEKAENWHSTGRTPLMAAMRCYVLSKFGGEVDLP